MEIENFMKKFEKEMKESKHIYVTLSNGAIIIADDYMRDEDLIYFFEKYVHYFTSGGSVSGYLLSGICELKEIKKLKSVNR